MADIFQSLNPYDNIEVLRADSPEALIELIKSIKVPIKILAFTSSGNRHYAYIQGLVKVKKVKGKPKE